jgi:hypothetical protein
VVFGSDLGQLLLEVHARRVVRAGVSVSRLAAGLIDDHGRPFDVLPQMTSQFSHGTPAYFGDHARRVAERLRAEIADALVDFQLAIRPQARRGRRRRSIRLCTRPLRSRSPRTLLPGALAAVGLARFPTEQLGALIERFLDEAAGQLVARASRRRVRRNETEERLAFGAFILRIAT